MLSELWQSFSGVTRFSIITFFVTAFLGFITIGALGAILYYPVSFLFSWKYGRFDEWSGDWVWPSMIAAGMSWSVGFLIAAAVYNYLHRQDLHIMLCWIGYAFTLWAWAAVVWLIFLNYKW